MKDQSHLHTWEKHSGHPTCHMTQKCANRMEEIFTPVWFMNRDCFPVRGFSTEEIFITKCWTNLLSHSTEERWLVEFCSLSYGGQGLSHLKVWLSHKVWLCSIWKRSKKWSILPIYSQPEANMNCILRPAAHNYNQTDWFKHPSLN